MANNSIWIIDDDPEDEEIITEVCKKINITNNIHFIQNAAAFFSRLKHAEEAPFLILCNTWLSGMSSFELRRHMLQSEENKLHSVPFIFISENNLERYVYEAYRLRANGYFVKPVHLDEWKNMLATIIHYWSQCHMPSKDAGYDAPLA